MLNISPNRVNSYFAKTSLNSLQLVESRKSGRVLIRLLAITGFIAVLALFLPWTQNVRARGNVTTLQPNQRPQTVHSVIAGRIEEWFVQEGDYVKKGDTIVFISEVKDEYFDPNLLDRTKEQLKSKEMSVKSYMEKVKALDSQIDALVETRKLKTEQAQNKVQQAHLKVRADSIDFQAATINLKIAKDQYKRMEDLNRQGLRSLTDLENRRLTVQKRQAELISLESKLLSSRNEVINAQVELASIDAQYKDDIAKAESNKFAAFSDMYDAEIAVTKLQNQFMNYSVRQDLYFITSPQNGYITQAIQSGIGETIKEGDQIVSIMPANYELAVAMYVEPLDLPLLEVGQKVRVQFDGWPAIVFSGWPNSSYGTYGGKIFAIDKFISDNGQYRVLVAADPEDYEWPTALSVGAGASNMVLLKDVFVWYELWRKVNGFPPDYYKVNSVVNNKTLDKKK